MYNTMQDKDMIKVLYDEGGFLMPHGGVSRYFVEMIKRLPDDIKPKLAMESTSNVYLQQSPFNLPPHKQTVHDFIAKTLHGHSFRGVSHVYKMLAQLMPRRFPSGELANERIFMSELKKGDFEILHLTGPHPVNNNWKSVVGRKPIVATVHDLIPEIVCGDTRVRKSRERLLKDATHIIAVSGNTKNDIMRLYGTPESKITVIYHGYLPVDVSGIKPFQSDKPYLLYVGKRDGYKRFDFFVHAVAPLLRSGDLRLFCTGTPFTENEQCILVKLGISDRVVQRFVTDEEMMALFAGAVAFVYPSEYEGFGIPILDAFSLGCPVVLSECSCFPEVAGNAALYFKKNDEDSLRLCIDTLLRDEGVRFRKIRLGLERVKLFSWDKCANETANIYLRVNGE